MKNIKLTEEELEMIISLMELAVWADRMRSKYDEDHEISERNISLLNKLRSYR